MARGHQSCQWKAKLILGIERLNRLGIKPVFHFVVSKTALWCHRHRDIDSALGGRRNGVGNRADGTVQYA